MSEILDTRNANNASIIRAINLAGVTVTEQSIPQSTMNGISNVYSDRDYEKVVGAISNDPNMQNAFVSGLATLVTSQAVITNNWQDPLGFLKRSREEIGRRGYHQEIVPDIIAAESYDFRSTDLFKLNRPRVFSQLYYSLIEKKFPTSISWEQIESAFNSEYGLSNLINGVLAELNSSAEEAQYATTVELIRRAAISGEIYNINAHLDGTADSLKSFSSKVKAMAERLTMRRTGKYNAAGAPVRSRKEDLFLVITPELQADLNVNVLADAFNIDKADISTRIIVLDEVPGPEGTHAILFDRKWFIIGDYTRQSTSFFNAETLVNNIYLHHHSMAARSNFGQAVMFSERPTDGRETVKVELTGLDAFVVDDTVEKKTNTVSISSNSVDSYTLRVNGVAEVTPGKFKNVIVAPNQYRVHFMLEDAEGNDITLQLSHETFVAMNGMIRLQRDLKPGYKLKIIVKSTYIVPETGEAVDEAVDTEVTVTVTE